MVSLLLWIVAFLGVAFIYAAKPASKLVTKGEPSPAAVSCFKGVGTFLCIFAVLMLYLLGKLI